MTGIWDNDVIKPDGTSKGDNVYNGIWTETTEFPDGRNTITSGHFNIILPLIESSNQASGYRVKKK